MAVLVTGGAGYIGSHTVAHLLKRDEQVIVVDHLQNGHKQAVRGGVLCEGDIRDQAFLRKVLQQYPVDAVIHFAASSLVGESMSDPAKYYSNNVAGTLSLLELMVDFEINKLVFSSTAAVYGEPQQIPIKETDRTFPHNVYGETKLAMEKMIRWFTQAHELEAISLRYFNAAGAHADGRIGEDHEPETHLIPLILQVALGQRECIDIFGNDYATADGTCVRDYIHVDDLAEAHILALQKLRRGGSSAVYNLGNGQGYSVQQVIETARTVTGQSIQTRVMPRRKGDPAVLVASSELAKRELGWLPQKNSLNDIIRDAWQWHLHHPDGYSMRIEKTIEQLLAYAKLHGLLGELDDLTARNQLMEMLQVSVPFAEPVDVQQAPEQADRLLARLLDYCEQQDIIEQGSTVARDLMEARMMGALMPRASECARRFREIAEQQSTREATDYFYKLCKAANYIQMERIRQNSHWSVETEYGLLEITINLAKPEKDPKDIAAIQNAPQVGYPKCPLCAENMGYAGRIDHPARQNHRIIPIDLQGQRWFFQYSPYLYYEHHSIVINEQHKPMQINEQTFSLLLDFLEQFPHYFVGSNADLPIVGGSILNHDHFQAGQHTFAMEKAAVEQTYKHPQYEDVAICRLNWPLSVIRLNSRNRQSLQDLASRVLNEWRGYSDEQIELLACSVNENGDKVPHNTITPIARKHSDGFELDLVLRNNRCSAQYPEGIFHPHDELHHIKKENIGLIEVMGLAILPGRLQLQLEKIGQIISGPQAEANISEISNNPAHPLYVHAKWMDECRVRWQAEKSASTNVETYLQQEVGRRFVRVLEDSGVFKRDQQGNQAFNRWMEKWDCRS